MPETGGDIKNKDSITKSKLEMGVVSAPKIMPFIIFTKHVPFLEAPLLCYTLMSDIYRRAAPYFTCAYSL